ncbi:4Fe-4S dicluster domain-containing protein [Mucilaginibacter gotjawali]|uniref:Ferredoxin n=2 Tax=Mucilaginibacter gotjawali TaxID=1550579 RepID=A0A839SN89_9SPHI|nr:4Fe-4S dicluster domain-containing protein [Mucilaginibacter gotjawali]MBB3058808.1 ferredoxin [Mucilaginibacter gotjawali]BAU53812.1 Anaerobic sulfite reductase subunit A [Mucilaginibacter gotjawali]
MKVIERKFLENLFDQLKEMGYDLFGPVVHDGAIVYDEIESAGELPAGWHDKQEKGTYRLEKSGDPSVFAYAAGPQSWKKLLHPSENLLWRAQRTENGFKVIKDPEPKRKKAFIGVRPCELNAILIQDKVFLKGIAVDASYQALRNDVFIVAVNCTHPANTCFCASMNTGPKATKGFDISLTEVLDGDRHYFLAESGSSLGDDVLTDVTGHDALDNEIVTGKKALENAAGKMGRNLDTTNIKELLYANSESPYWDEVAARCLSCGNCTMVCPTCFCTTVEDKTDLTGQHDERWSKWDSCFSLEFSYIHTGPVRSTVRSRYRQWMTHKLASWIDQFGTSGCVGCGRCITWCPVGIDITEGLASIRNNQTEKTNQI